MVNGRYKQSSRPHERHPRGRFVVGIEKRTLMKTIRELNKCPSMLTVNKPIL